MTFTQFLNNPDSTTAQPSFAQLARHDPLWPSQANRLEDFEAFLLARLEDEGAEVISEVRDLWREYAAEAPGEKHDLDLVVAAWGDYARHLQSCTGTSLNPCEAAQELLQRALDESCFEDLDDSTRPTLPCDGSDDDVEGEDEEEPRDRGDWAGWGASDDEEEDRADLN